MENSCSCRRVDFRSVLKALYRMSQALVMLLLRQSEGIIVQSKYLLKTYTSVAEITIQFPDVCKLWFSMHLSPLSTVSCAMMSC